MSIGEENMLFDHALHTRKKIPILIPIWKYVDQSKQNPNQHKQSLHAAHRFSMMKNEGNYHH